MDLGIQAHFSAFFYKIHQIILKTWIYHSTGHCDTNHCSCRGHRVGCTDYCNCDLSICQNTDGSPSALINEDLDNELVYKNNFGIEMNLFTDLFKVKANIKK